MLFRLIPIIALPLAAMANPVSFQRELAPMLQRRCASCHDGESAKGGYRLDTFTRLQRAGDSELAPVVGGKSNDSELFRLLLENGAEDRMPQKADPLPETEIALIKRWIDEGGKFDGTSPDQPLVEMIRQMMLGEPPEHYPRALPVAAFAFSPDGAQVAVGGYHEVTIWNLADGTLASRMRGLPERITGVAWHQTLPWIAVAAGTPMQWGTVALLDPNGIAPTRFLCDLGDTALAVSFSPDGNLLAAGCADRSIRLYDIATGTETRTMRVHADWVQSVSFRSDSRELITASRDRTARVIDPARGEVVASYTNHDSPLMNAVFAPDGKFAWSLGRGGIIERWNPADGERKGGMKGPDFQYITMTAAGLMAATSEGTIQFYPGTADKPAQSYALKTGPVASCVLSPDGTRLALGRFDGKITIVDAKDGKPVTEFAAWPQ